MIKSYGQKFKFFLPPLSQPHFWKSVRMTLTLPKWGLGSPPELPKLQSSIAGVKTPCLEALSCHWKAIEV